MMKKRASSGLLTESTEAGTGSFKLSRILLVDDESEIVELCARALRKSYLVVKTSSPFEAMSFMDAGRHMIDLVICDYCMPGLNGVEFVDKIREIGIATPVILHTGKVARREAKEFDKFAKVLQKPFGAEELLSEVSSVLVARQAEADLYQRYKGIIPHLNVSIDNLESALRGLGVEQPANVSPEKAMDIFGPGEAYRVFLSWHNLHDLRNKIAA